MLKSKQSFTVIEVVMVIVLMAILTALAIPRFDSFYSIKLEGAARKLVADMRFAQRLAIAKHAIYGVEFNSGPDNYRVYLQSDNSTAVDPSTRSNFIIDYSADSEFKGIDLDSASFVAGSSNLEFNFMGAPGLQSASWTNLSSSGTVTLSYQGETKTVTVAPNTGKVSLQ